MPRAPKPLPCPNCGGPLPVVTAAHSWHYRQTARRIIARHLSPSTPGRQCLSPAQLAPSLERRADAHTA